MKLPPHPAPSIESLIDDAWSIEPELPRPHLGASAIGAECGRQLWYGFRWATSVTHPGRLLRLFNRGHLEETRFVADLKRIGVEVLERDPTTGKQFNYADLGGHFAGSGDGLAMNVPGAEKTPHILEFKTSADKPFKALEKDGVRKGKPLHFDQMQMYMHWQGFTRALYMVVNKNDERLYTERVVYEKSIALALIEKARRIIEASEPPARVSENPGFYSCKWCDHYEPCHQQKAARVSCRTCISATPRTDGEGGWYCEDHGKALTVADQRKACADHRFIPPLLPFAELVGGDQETRRLDYKVIATDARFSNGTKGAGSYLSTELQDMMPSAICDPGVELLRERFDGTVETTHSAHRVDPFGPITEDDIPF